MLQASGDGGIASAIADLRQAGDAGPELQTESVVGKASVKLIDEVRTLRTRPNQAHLTPYHVDELWKLIKA